MKKFLLKLMTVILAVAMITGTMASCGLFEVDTDRDLERAVAVVNIDKGLDSSKQYGIKNVANVSGKDDYEGEPIYKRELIAGFMSYGYMYVQSYGYSAADTYNLILDNLVNNKIIMQYAKGDLAKKGGYDTAKVNEVMNKLVDAYGENILAVLASDRLVQEYNKEFSKGKKDEDIKFGTADYLKGLSAKVKAENGKISVNDSLYRFLDYETVVKSIATTIDSVNDLIESFMDEEHAHEHENISYTTRTAPTMDEEEDDTVSEEELEEFLAKTVKLDSKDRKNALAEAKERFVELGLIDSHETYEATDMLSVLSLTYFRSALLGTLESEIITKFEDLLREEHKLHYDVAADQNALWESYKALAKSQTNQFEGSVSGLESALGAISKNSFVTYNPGEGYGYVSHFLVQYDEELKAEIDELIQEKIDANGAITAEEKEQIVNAKVLEITVEDLRATWVQSGYGVLEGDRVRFTDDYVYTDVLAYYDGSFESVTAHEEEDEDGNKVLHFNYFGVKPEKRDFDYFKGVVADVIGVEAVELNKAGQVDYDEALKERFEDLKFAYSSDEGNFNSYLGYLYSPITSSNQYVSAFAKAAEIVCNGNGLDPSDPDYFAGGAGAYMMFGSYEYGLHIVLCTKKVSELIYTVEGDAGKQQFILDLISGEEEDEDTVAYNFLEATNALLESNVISKLANTYIQQGLNSDTGVVVKYEKVYSDLVEESEE